MMSRLVRITLLALGISATAFFIGCDLSPSQGAYLTVSPDRCIGCGKCATVCDGDAIVIMSNKAIIDPSKCIRCYKCIDICPVEAIQ